MLIFLVHLLITILTGAAGVLLLDKWKLDNYANMHPFLSKFWPQEPCLLCRAFWIGCAVYVMLMLIPNSIYVFVPFAAIPAQVLLFRFILKFLK